MYLYTYIGLSMSLHLARKEETTFSRLLQRSVGVSKQTPINQKFVYVCTAYEKFQKISHKKKVQCIWNQQLRILPCFVISSWTSIGKIISKPAFKIRIAGQFTHGLVQFFFCRVWIRSLKSHPHHCYYNTLLIFQTKNLCGKFAAYLFRMKKQEVFLLVKYF